MKVGTFLIILIIVIMGFSVYAYKLRTAYNVDARDEEIKTLENKFAILKYVIVISPKTDVSHNAIKEKFPDIKDYDDILDLLGMKKPEKTEEKKEEKRTVASSMDNML